MTDDTVPISELGIGDGDAIERFGEYETALAEEFDALDYELHDDVLSRILHFRVEFEGLNPPRGFSQWCARNGLVQFHFEADAEPPWCAVSVTEPGFWEAAGGVSD